MNSAKRIISSIFSLDLRSLALLRILTGLLILVDLADRSTDLVIFYTDLGAYPRSAISAKWDPWSVSIHLINGTWQAQSLLFLIAGFFAVLLILGYRTRLVSLISWFLLISLHARSFLILHGGDQLLRQILFFGMFLPWGIRFSLDSWKSKNKFSENNSYISFATFGYIFQIGSLYVFSSIYKSAPVWRKEGTAIYYALSLNDFATRFGLFMRQFPQILKIETFTVYWLEAVAPFFLLTPVFNGAIRTLLVFIFICVHIGMGIHLYLGIFPAVCAIAWCGLLPSWFWEKFVSKLRFPKTLPNISVPFIHKIRGENKTDLLSNRLFYESKLISGLVLFATIYIFIWNFLDVSGNSKMFPNQFSWIASTFGIYQKWDMFAPGPGRRSGWFVIPAQLKNGKVVDILNNGGPVSWEKPEVPSESYKSVRWAKYLYNISKKENRRSANNYMDYLCRKWNSEHNQNEQVITLSMIYIFQITLPENKYTDPQQAEIVQRKCQ